METKSETRNPKSEIQVALIEEHSALRTPHSEFPEGWVWEAEILRPGVSMNRDPATGLPRYYPPEFVREAAPAFEGCPCFADHQPSASGSVRDLVGVFRKVHVAQTFLPAKEGQAGTPAPLVLLGELHLLRSEGWARDKLRAAQDAGLPVGLSISAFIGFVRATRPDASGKPQEVMEARQLIRGLPLSVDLVTVPAAGGRVVRALAGLTSSEPGMRSAEFPSLEDSALRTPHSTFQTGSVYGAKGATLMELTNQLAAPENGAEHLRAEVGALEDRVRHALAAQQAAEGRLLLERKLADSKLPEPLAALVRERVVGADQRVRPGADTLVCPYPAEQIESEIRRVREAYAAVVPSPTRLAAGPGSRVQLVQDPADKMQIALDKLFGVKAGADGAPYDASVPAFRSFQEAYICLTGDRDFRWTLAGSRVTEDWNSTGFANALGNTLHRRMIQDYRDVDYGLDLLIPGGEPHRIALRDFRTHEVVRVGYLGDLPQVDPELVDWPEIAPPTDEKATLTAVQFGGIVTVTRKHVINDDVGTVAKVTARLGRAARRTMARRVFNFLVNNPTIYDGLAFFHATHINLGSTALSATELDVVRKNMRDQKEKDSNEKLGISPYILVVPHALEGKSRQENERDYLDSSFTPNPVRFIFGAQSERIVVSPLLTDTNDWYVFANPRELQTFQLGFLQGREEPELLLADSESVGKAFSSDRIQYKVRHEYEVTVVDFRGAYKETVA